MTTYAEIAQAAAARAEEAARKGWLKAANEAVKVAFEATTEANGAAIQAARENQDAAAAFAAAAAADAAWQAADNAVARLEAAIWAGVMTPADEPEAPADEAIEPEAATAEAADNDDDVDDGDDDNDDDNDGDDDGDDDDNDDDDGDDDNLVELYPYGWFPEPPSSYDTMIYRTSDAMDFLREREEGKWEIAYRYWQALLDHARNREWLRAEVYSAFISGLACAWGWEDLPYIPS